MVKNLKELEKKLDLAMYDKIITANEAIKIQDEYIEDDDWIEKNIDKIIENPKKYLKIINERIKKREEEESSDEETIKSSKSKSSKPKPEYDENKHYEISDSISKLQFYAGVNNKNIGTQEIVSENNSYNYDKAKELLNKKYKEIGLTKPQLYAFYNNYLKGIKPVEPEPEEPKKQPVKKGRPKKEEPKPEPPKKIIKKEEPIITKPKSKISDNIGTVVDGKSKLVKSNAGKYSVETEINIKKDLNDKIKKALKQSILTELDNKMKGSGIRDIELDYSSDDMYGMGYEIDSSSDEEDTEEYSKILKHLVGHITDKKEKLDKLDAKQAKEIINKLIKKRGRPKK